MDDTKSSPSDIVRDLGNEGRAAIIRRLLLEISSGEERTAILYDAAVCVDCGEDLLVKGVTRRFCQCTNDE